MRNLSPKAVALEGDFTHRSLHVRGGRLHAASAGNPSDPAVVLLHDSLTCWVDFAHILPLLATQGFHVAALDLRGFGMSDKPPSGYDYRHSCGDIAGAIRALGHDRAHLVGMGVGGALAWTLCYSHPNHIASITTVEMVHPSDLRRLRRSRPWLLRTQASVAISASTLRPSAWPAMIEHALRATTTPEFHDTQAFKDNLQWRNIAMNIAATGTPVKRMSRLPFTPTPVKWAEGFITTPAHILTDHSPMSQALVTLARKRTTRRLELTHVDGTKLRPHLENPQGFVDTVATFVGGLSG